MVRLLPGALAALVTCALSHARPDVWSVNVGGGGDFTELQPAVDHALPGDTILVWGPANGHYEFPAAVITKGVTVVGLAPEYVRFDDLTVRGVPEGQWVTLVNVSVGEWQVFPIEKVWDDGHGGPGLLVEDCVGPVVLQGCRFWGAIDQPGGPGMRVVRSDVALLDCELLGGHRGGAGSSSSGLPNAQHGLVLEQARAFVAGSAVRGGEGGYVEDHSQGHIGGRGGHGLFTHGWSRVWLVSSDVVGGAGMDVTGFGGDYYGGDGGHGVRLGGGAAGIRRDTRLRGGIGGWGLTADGRNGESLVGPLVTSPGSRLSLEAPRWVRDVDTLQVEVVGEPGAVGYLVVGDRVGFSDLGAAAPLVAGGGYRIALGPLPPSGELLVDVPLPEVEPGGAHSLVLQTVFQESNGAAVGEARVVTVLGERLLPDGVTRLYVDAAAAPGGDGITWATAIDNLRRALELAHGVGPGRTEIWVRSGTYRPVPSGPVAIEPFFVKSRTYLYGGFDGTETALDQRQVRANPTVLSGDLPADDSRSVLAVGPWEPRTQVRIDGVVVTGGVNADVFGHVTPFNASGMELRGDIDVVDCVVAENSLTPALHYWGMGKLRVAHSRFLRNKNGGDWPSGFGTCRLGWSLPGEALFVGCEFVDNKVRWGGGIYTHIKTRVENSTFFGNNAKLSGGAIYQMHHGESLEVANSILWNNGTQEPIAGTGSGRVVHHSLYPNGSKNKWGKGNVDGPAYLVDPRGPDGILGTLDDDLMPSSVSPAVDSGRNDLVSVDLFDLDHDRDTSEPWPLDSVGMRRFFDDPFVPDTGIGSPPVVDMGSRERQ